MELNYSAVLIITWILYSTLLFGTTIRTVMHFLPPGFIRRQQNIEEVKLEKVKILKLFLHIEFFLIISGFFHYYYIFY